MFLNEQTRAPSPRWEITICENVSRMFVNKKVDEKDEKKNYYLITDLRSTL